MKSPLSLMSSHPLFSLRCLSTAIVFTLMTTQVLAQIEKNNDFPAESASNAKVNRWIDQLADDSSTVRETARENLVAEGIDAVEPLKLAAINGDPQTAYSSLRLLAEMISREGAVSATAKKAVTEIAESETPSARQAKKILEQAPSKKDSPRDAFKDRGMPFNGRSVFCINVEDERYGTGRH